MYKSFFYSSCYCYLSLFPRNMLFKSCQPYLCQAISFTSHFGANFLCSCENYLNGLSDSETKMKVDNNVLSNRYKETYLAFFCLFVCFGLREYFVRLNTRVILVQDILCWTEPDITILHHLFRATEA